MCTVQVREVVLGEGIPKVCIPLMGRTKQELLEELKELEAHDFDLVEWRVDFFQNIMELSLVEEILKVINQKLKNIPVLMTLRRKVEGGNCDLPEGMYFKFIQETIKMKGIDLIDVELLTSEEKIKETIYLAHEAGIKVILSNHDFLKTPARDELISCLKKMQALGADLCKIAVMPQNPKDVLVVLEATYEMYTLYAKCPIITIAMGEQGMISRLAGEVFGSAMTFGVAKKASAPGQVPVKELQSILKLFHQAI